MINILLVDDHQIIIDGLRGLLEEDDSIGNLYEAQNGLQTIQIAKAETIDLVLLDINLPDKSGFDICQELKKDENCPKIIALTMHGNAGYINKMIKSGVDGYLLKNTGREELLKAIQVVMGGNRYFSREVTDLLVAGIHEPKKPKSSDFIQKLTRREKEVLQLILKEYTNKEIASELFISLRTVDAHKRNLLEKTGSKNVAGLVLFAINYQLFDDL